MTDAQYNEVIDLLRKVERLVRSAAPPGHIAPLCAPDDHIYQTPARLPRHEPVWTFFPGGEAVLTHAQTAAEAHG